MVILNTFQTKAAPFPLIISFSCTKLLYSKGYCRWFLDEETETQRGEKTKPKARSW